MERTIKYFEKRRRDVELTEKVSELIDEILKRENFLFIRNNDVKLQKKGVDLIVFNSYGKPHVVDEKYALSCWNRDLQTYSFEIYSKNNIDNNGWLTSEYHITQDYMLVWLRSTDEELNDIYRLEMAFLSRKAVLEYLSDNGVDIKTILNEFEEKAKNNGAKRELVINKNIKVVQSLKLYEAPINILITKDVLLSLAYYHHIFMKNSELRIGA